MNRLGRIAVDAVVHEEIVQGDVFHKIMSGMRRAIVASNPNVNVGDALHFFLEESGGLPCLFGQVTDVNTIATKLDDDRLVVTIIVSFRLSGDG